MTVYDLPDGSLVRAICALCGIEGNPESLTDDQIARVCKWLGENEPRSTKIDGEPAISRAGWDMMILVTIMDFPGFFEKHQLAMVWRN